MTRKTMIDLSEPPPRKLGAPYGNRNARKTGAHTAEVRAWRQRVAQWRRRVRAALAEVERNVKHRSDRADLIVNPSLEGERKARSRAARSPE